MAGAGYKLFNTGDVLTASDVNTYLQQQVVMVFASAAARTSALSGVLAEGMVTYLQDTNSVQVYNGTAFVAVGGSSPLTTKGDLYTFGTSDTRLGVGANGTVLTANSATATGLEFATPASGAPTSATNVVQALESTSSGSYTDLTTAGPAVTITTGTKALVLYRARIMNSTAAETATMTFAVSGATTVAASFEYQTQQQGPAFNEISFSGHTLLTGLTAGSNTFTMKYRAGGGLAFFQRREITVIDMGS